MALCRGCLCTCDDVDNDGFCSDSCKDDWFDEAFDEVEDCDPDNLEDESNA